MRICGVELTGSEAILALIEVSDGVVSSLHCQTKKIRLDDDTSETSVKSFYDAVCGFLRDERIQHIALKQRATRGKFAGGSVTFKMEALFQLSSDATTALYSAQAIAAAQRKHQFVLPEHLNQYQEQAYRTALCAALSAT